MKLFKPVDIFIDWDQGSHEWFWAPWGTNWHSDMKLVFYFPSLASSRPGPASWFLDAINIDFPLLPRHWSPHMHTGDEQGSTQVLAFDFFILSFHLQRLQNGQENTQDIYCFIVFDSRSGAAWLVTSIMCCTTLFHRRSILVQNYATLQHDKNIIFEIILYCAGICSTNCQSLLQLSSWDTCWPCLVSRTSSHAYKLSHHFPSCRVSSC